MAPSRIVKLERELTQARILRDAALRSIQNLHALAEEVSLNAQKGQLFLARYNSLERSIRTFETEQQTVLTSLIELNREHEFIESDSILKDRLENLSGEIEVVYASLQDVTPNMHIGGERDNYNSSTRSLILPKIELPRFDGNPVQWRTFRDMFISLVHENGSISEIERFHYLLSCLTGPALNIVKSVPLTSDNYAIAWRALNERYDSQRLLATAHLDKIFLFEKLQRESVPSLLSFISTFRENVAAIQALGVNDLAGFILFYIGARVVDSETRRLFESSLPQNVMPDLEALLVFVAQRCKVLENVGSGRDLMTTSIAGQKKSKGERSSAKTSLAASTLTKNPTKTDKCMFCDRSHLLYRCYAFKRQPAAARREFVISKKICFICLRSDHMVGACTASYLCRTCEGRHNTLIHVDNSSMPSKTTTSNTAGPSTPPSFSGAAEADIKVVLATAVVRVRSHGGELATVRILLDSGSQISAISNECATRLGLPRYKGRAEVVGLAQQPVTNTKGVTKCSFVPLTSDSPRFTANNVIILSTITSSMPHERLPDSIRERYSHLSFADPEFDVPGPIDMLIGGDLYPFILQQRSEIIHSPGLPSALCTQLGWVIVGVLNEAAISSLVSLQIRTAPAINDIMQRFWAVEEADIPTCSKTEDEQCERWFTNTVSRDHSGRFHVALPLRAVVVSHSDGTLTENEISRDACSIGLGSSRLLALNRLYNLERRLNKDPDLYKAYRIFMDEYIALGHMRLANCDGEYFIPHHPVVKRVENKIKIRVVFDASAKSSTGLSLNDCLVTGPKLQAEIGDILLRTRVHKYIFIADIVKMYRQICIQEKDRVFQHILWRNSPHEEVQEYELCTVTYGMSAAPFLAIRCLHQLDHDDGPEFPLAKHLLITSTYVDDIIAGANSDKEVVQLQGEVIALLKRGCFELKKWASNCVSVLNNVPEEDLATDPCFEPSDGNSVKVLGLFWEPKGDTFGYRSNTVDPHPTKRSILSAIARLYDPIGVLGPSIFWAKCLMQQLWCQKLDWDTPVPTEISSAWNTFITDLTSLAYLKIPRHINVEQQKEAQLVGFSDASQRGYAATVFLRVTDNFNYTNVYFITCKSKIAPLKSSQTDISLTIPRLELCAAVLLARLLSHTLRVLQDTVNISRVRAFSDSTIVLAWLRTEQKVFKVFVTNRISKIKELLPDCHWSHVISKENAADPSSRGLVPGELVTCSLHLNGPEFLCQPEAHWPNSVQPTIPPDQLPEYQKGVQCVLHVQENREPEELFLRFSSLMRMQRVLAYCLRFGDRCRKRLTEHGVVTFNEMDRVLTIFVKTTQDIYWASLQKQLKNSSMTVTPNSLAQLSPFFDSKNIIRVGGRLRFSCLSDSAKHPVLLPKASHLTRLIISHYHLSLLHAGQKLVLSMIQRKFWIVSGRAAIRQFIHACVPCVRYKAACPQPCMADLPEFRVQPHRPFSFVGMDYGGPFLVKESRRRNARTGKAYLALFVCLSIKAVHLEVVSDLSTEAFLAAFDRFIARRGIPVEIHTDCGTNYVGAARQLKALFDEANMQDTLGSRIPCRWKFNPPAAPHFGGIWEAAIKSAKTHLKKVLGVQVLTLEELTTLIVRIEGILNSRPLAANSNDPNDSTSLTPGHFLIGQPLMAIPEQNFIRTPINHLKRWQLLQQAQQSFWKRWTREYLHTLQSRQKWSTQNPSVMVGDLVTINSPNSPPMTWQLGRVTKVHPGADHVVRVATVQTASGTLTRPVVKLVKLPVSA